MESSLRLSSVTRFSDWDVWMPSRDEKAGSGSESGGVGARTRRADARRNRARVLAAAEEIFTTVGPGASTEEIARLAGVGVGTVFRHFPTKEALLEAVYVERFRQLTAEAAALASHDDPGAAFFTFFTSAVNQSARKSALATALADAGVDIKGMQTAVAIDLRHALQGLLLRAQAAGAVRADIGVADLIALLVGASRAIEQGGQDQTVQRRTLDVICDGMRPRAT
jgi:AcrR family transcriptional regulator